MDLNRAKTPSSNKDTSIFLSTPSSIYLSLTHTYPPYILGVYIWLVMTIDSELCVCVCVCERERERKRVCICVCLGMGKKRELYAGSFPLRHNVQGSLPLRCVCVQGSLPFRCVCVQGSLPLRYVCVQGSLPLRYSVQWCAPLR